MIELTFREGVKLRRSLRMAIPSASALAQLVFDQFHEDFKTLVGDGEYGEQLVKLLVWAEANKKTVELLHGARVANPGDDLLLEFETEYTAQRQHAGGGIVLPPQVLTPELRKQLVDAVMLIPTTESFDGRSAYLAGVPTSTNRHTTNALADLNTIFEQLNKLGKLNSGEWPLLIVIDNILTYVDGFELHKTISQLRKTLSTAYENHG
jgi:hypothetical protein